MTSLVQLTFDRPVAVIGDIHGRLDLLDAVLMHAKVRGRAIVVIGDLCDRGPDTRGVLDRLVAVGAVGVRGNHDQWLLAWARGEGFDSAALLPNMAGGPTLVSYGVQGRTPRAVEAEAWRVPAEHRDLLASLGTAASLEVGGAKFWLVHAGVPTHVELPRGIALAEVVPWLAANEPNELLWPSGDPEMMLPLDRPVIMGHVPRNEPIDTGEVIAIDTGAGTLAQGRLTALLLPERKFVTVGPLD